MSKKAVGYIRISRLKEKGVSLEAQAEKIRAMAIVHDAEVEIVADDGETGKNTRRPGLELVLAMVRRREVDLVIVAKLDRLTQRQRPRRDPRTVPAPPRLPHQRGGIA